MKRRDFIKESTAAGSAWTVGGTLASGPAPQSALSRIFPPQSGLETPPLRADRLPDLAPARWIWYPSGRCLQNTFVLFRRALDLPAACVRAAGWISADSRYLLEVNGRRIQWGPSPCDPRWLEADPLDLASALAAGPNVIGATVLFYGQGDGTSPLGKPGFLFHLEMECADGSRHTVVSDPSWRAHLARAWTPGHYKRWYLRALQEDFDARLYPYGWTTPAFAPNHDWLPAMPLDCPPSKPPLCSTYPDYLFDTAGVSESCALRPRRIPQMKETQEPARLAESVWIVWKRPPEEFFECRPPDAFEALRESATQPIAEGQWRVDLDGARAAALTFELPEQMVGWPYFSIDAAAGTTVELMVQEGHTVGGPALLNTHFDSWTRFICREGRNRFETFDYESCRWIQLHIRGARGAVTVSDVGLRRRVFPWPRQPHVRFEEPALDRLIEASVNTLNNSALETLMDGAGRERQQYSGDGGHQMRAVHLTLGESRLPARYLATYSQGITKDGFFLDCWPAYDRLARLMERQLDLTTWGPLLDHGVGFNFDNYYHHMYSGRLDDIREPFPRLLRFARYLESLVRADGLLPVEDLGVPAVWIDHIAYQRQRHKQCAFNLYAAAMFQHALAPICRAFGDRANEEAALNFGRQLQAATVRRFWSPQRETFINNLPWLDEEKQPRMCDRSLATAILYDQCPGGRTANPLRALVECPPEMGFSYPANAGWRLWALAQGGRADVVVKEFRERWATLDSVRLNNTLQEDWAAHPDSSSEWSHCPVAPLYVTHLSLAGVRPLEPGFRRCEIRPQPADLQTMEVTTYTPLGPLVVETHGKLGARDIALNLPAGCAGELVVHSAEKLSLPTLAAPAPSGHVSYRLPAGETKLHLIAT
ncbi:MAG: alpha-L-rhamnosidase N-terminal domain-containing protein [Bryobacteraceae bacterium]